MKNNKVNLSEHFSRMLDAVKGAGKKKDRVEQARVKELEELKEMEGRLEKYETLKVTLQADLKKAEEAVTKVTDKVAQNQLHEIANKFGKAINEVNKYISKARKKIGEHEAKLQAEKDKAGHRGLVSRPTGSKEAPGPEAKFYLAEESGEEIDEAPVIVKTGEPGVRVDIEDEFASHGEIFDMDEASGIHEKMRVKRREPKPAASLRHEPGEVKIIKEAAGTKKGRQDAEEMIKTFISNIMSEEEKPKPEGVAEAPEAPVPPELEFDADAELSMEAAAADIARQKAEAFAESSFEKAKIDNAVTLISGAFDKLGVDNLDKTDAYVKAQIKHYSGGKSELDQNFVKFLKAIDGIIRQVQSVVSGEREIKDIEKAQAAIKGKFEPEAVVKKTKNKIKRMTEAYIKAQDAAKDFLNQIKIGPTPQPPEPTPVMEPTPQPPAVKPPAELPEEKSAEKISFEEEASKEISFNTGAVSEASKERRELNQANQDAYINRPDIGFFAVFDGMGGHFGGNEASREAAEILTEWADNFHKDVVADKLDIVGVKAALKMAAVEANAKILLHGDGRGTTISLVYMFTTPDKEVIPIILNIGDSRVYLVDSEKNLTTVTTDDGPGGQKEEDQSESDNLSVKEDFENLSTDSQINWSFRNQLTACVGATGGVFEDDFNEDTHLFNLKPLNQGEWLILTSDGIHDNLTADEIKAVLKDNNELDPDSLAKKVKEAARTRADEVGHFRAKDDDMTVVIVRLRPETVSLTRPKPEPDQAVDVAGGAKKPDDWATRALKEADEIAKKNAADEAAKAAEVSKALKDADADRAARTADQIRRVLPDSGLASRPEPLLEISRDTALAREQLVFGADSVGSKVFIDSDRLSQKRGTGVVAVKIVRVLHREVTAKENRKYSPKYDKLKDVAEGQVGTHVELQGIPGQTPLNEIVLAGISEDDKKEWEKSRILPVQWVQKTMPIKAEDTIAGMFAKEAEEKRRKANEAKENGKVLSFDDLEEGLVYRMTVGENSRHMKIDAKNDGSITVSFIADDYEGKEEGIPKSGVVTEQEITEGKVIFSEALKIKTEFEPDEIVMFQAGLRGRNKDIPRFIPVRVVKQVNDGKDYQITRVDKNKSPFLPVNVPGIGNVKKKSNSNDYIVPREFLRELGSVDISLVPDEVQSWMKDVVEKEQERAARQANESARTSARGETAVETQPGAFAVGDEVNLDALFNTGAVKVRITEVLDGGKRYKIEAVDSGDPDNPNFLPKELRGINIAIDKAQKAGDSGDEQTGKQILRDWENDRIVPAVFLKTDEAVIEPEPEPEPADEEAQEIAHEAREAFYTFFNEHWGGNKIVREPVTVHRKGAYSFKSEDEGVIEYLTPGELGMSFGQNEWELDEELNNFNLSPKEVRALFLDWWNDEILPKLKSGELTVENREYEPEPEPEPEPKLIKKKTENLEEKAAREKKESEESASPEISAELIMSIVDSEKLKQIQLMVAEGKTPEEVETVFAEVFENLPDGIKQYLESLKTPEIRKDIFAVITEHFKQMHLMDLESEYRKKEQEQGFFSRANLNRMAAAAVPAIAVGGVAAVGASTAGFGLPAVLAVAGGAGKLAAEALKDAGQGKFGRFFKKVTDVFKKMGEVGDDDPSRVTAREQFIEKQKEKIQKEGHLYMAAALEVFIKNQSGDVSTAAAFDVEANIAKVVARLAESKLEKQEARGKKVEALIAAVRAKRERRDNNNPKDWKEQFKRYALATAHGATAGYAIGSFAGAGFLTKLAARFGVGAAGGGLTRFGSERMDLSRAREQKEDVNKVLALYKHETGASDEEIKQIGEQLQAQGIGNVKDIWAQLRAAGDTAWKTGLFGASVGAFVDWAKTTDTFKYWLPTETEPSVGSSDETAVKPAPAPAEQAPTAPAPAEPVSEPPPTPETPGTPTAPEITTEKLPAALEEKLGYDPVINEDVSGRSITAKMIQDFKANPSRLQAYKSIDGIERILAKHPDGTGLTADELKNAARLVYRKDFGTQDLRMDTSARGKVVVAFKDGQYKLGTLDGSKVEDHLYTRGKGTGSIKPGQKITTEEMKGKSWLDLQKMAKERGLVVEGDKVTPDDKLTPQQITAKMEAEYSKYQEQALKSGQSGDLRDDLVYKDGKLVPAPTDEVSAVGKQTAVSVGEKIPFKGELPSVDKFSASDIQALAGGDKETASTSAGAAVEKAGADVKQPVEAAAGARSEVLKDTVSETARNNYDRVYFKAATDFVDRLRDASLTSDAMDLGGGSSIGAGSKEFVNSIDTQLAKLSVSRPISPEIANMLQNQSMPDDALLSAIKQDIVAQLPADIQTEAAVLLGDVSDGALHAEGHAFKFYDQVSKQTFFGYDKNYTFGPAQSNRENGILAIYDQNGKFVDQANPSNWHGAKLAGTSTTGDA